MTIRYLLFLYFLALFAMGIFHITVTPVFEGFDENAHYSRIREFAYQDKIPMPGRSFLDQAVVDYQGPASYDSGEPPFDSRMVYYKFFNRKDLIDNYLTHYRQDILDASFVPSKTGNWESQHPPLYYALMATILKLVDDQDLVTQVLFLRLFSYLLALFGVALGILAIMQRGAGRQNFPLLLGFVIYPFMLPMFFQEFARIGNDSLCLSFVGLVAVLLSQWMANGGGVKLSLAMGVTLGLGLLTKALFIPIAAAIIGFILIWFLIEGHANQKVLKMALNLSCILLPAIAIGGIWYIYNYLVLGSFTGANVAIELSREGGLLANIVNTFSFPPFVRAIATSLVTFVWGGTWSVTHLPHFLYIPLMVSVVWIFGVFCLRLREISFSDTLWLSVWLIFFFVAGFSWHALQNIAVGGNPNTPGWYLHIALPFLAPAMGVGIQSVLRNSKSKFLFLSLLAYSIIFYFLAIWSQLALFAGCAIKGDDKQYIFQSNLFCLDHITQMIDHLTILGHPFVGMIGFCVWAICTVLLLRELRFGVNVSSSIR